MPDYTGLWAEWQEMLARRLAMGEALALWTSVLDGWRRFNDSGIARLTWSAEDCLERWKRGVPLLADATPAIAREPLEELLGPLMERLAAAGPDDAETLQRFAAAWDESRIGAASLFPTSGKDRAAASLPLLPGVAIGRHGAARGRGRRGGLLRGGVPGLPRLSQGPGPAGALERAVAARGRLGLAPRRLLRRAGGILACDADARRAGGRGVALRAPGRPGALRPPADRGRLAVPHGGPRPAGSRARPRAGADPRRGCVGRDLGRGAPRSLDRAPLRDHDLRRLLPAGDPRAGPRSADGAPRSRARAAVAERLGPRPRVAGPGGIGRARPQLRQRHHVRAPGAADQVQADRHQLLRVAGPRDARPPHAGDAHRGFPVPHRGAPPWPAPGGAVLGQRARGRPAGALLSAHVAGLRGDAVGSYRRPVAGAPGGVLRDRGLLRAAS